MRRLSSIAFGLCAAAALAQAPGIDGISLARMRADIAFLSSEALDGRKSLQRGSDVAAGFIAAEFAKAGLAPAAGGSFLQEFALLEYRTDPRERRLGLRRGGSERRYEYGRDYTGGALPRDYEAGGPVVFAGYGITAPEFGYDDYAGIDVRGKFVLIFEHEPRENDPQSVFNGLGNTRHAGPRLKLLNAQRRGAIGVLVLAEPNRKHPSAAERMARAPGPRPRAAASASQALAESDVRIPSFALSDEAGRELLAAAGKTPAELQAAIDRTLEPAALELPDTRIEARLVTAECRRALTANVLGLIEGSDPRLKDETVIFGSHYDHLGVRSDGAVYPGADDNASGTAAVIELARAFAASPRRPRRTLLFASFGAEEAGLLGSYYYAAHPARPLAATRAVLNLDMIGRDEKPSAQTEKLIRIAADTSNELNLVGSVYSPELRAVIERENRAIGLRLNYKWEDDAALNILFRCDHFPFLARDVPAVWFFNGFTPDYHQPSDTIEKINFTKMLKIVRLAYAAGWALANQDGAPRFVPNPRGK